MRRLEQGGRTVYVERHRGWSLIYFGASLAALVATGAALEREKAEAAAGLAVVCVGYSAYAALLLRKMRLIHIDPDAWVLSETLRPLLGATREFRSSTVGLKVLVESHVGDRRPE